MSDILDIAVFPNINRLTRISKIIRTKRDILLALYDHQ